MQRLIATVLILAAVAIFFVYTNSTYGGTTGSGNFSDKSIQELLEDKKEYNAALEKTAEFERIKSGHLSIYRSIPETKLERLKQNLPDHVDSVRLIIDIADMAQKHGMVMQDFTITGIGNSSPSSSAQTQSSPSQESGSVEQSSFGTPEKDYDSVSVGFKVSGTYDDMLAFVRDLEYSLRVIDITSLEFKSDESGVYDFDFSITTYFLK